MLEISELGLVEMTRKRVRQSLQSLFCAAVPDLQGQRRGQVGRDPRRRDLPQDPGAEHRRAPVGRWSIRVHPEMAHHLESSQREGLERLQALIGRKIGVQAMPSYHREQYELTVR